MIRRSWLLLALVTSILAHCSRGAHVYSDEGFVRDSDCTWTRPPQCGGGTDRKSSSYKIDLHVMTGDDRNVSDRVTTDRSSNDEDAIGIGFPRELKKSARLAANTWLRAIRGRPAHAIEMKLPEGCGPSVSNRTSSGRTKVGDLVVCLKMDADLGSALASAQRWGAAARSDKLPRVVMVAVNARVAGEYDRCDWNNILMHELGHAMGFARETFLGRGLVHRQRDDRLAPVFLGENAKREWEAMGGSKAANMYPPLLLADGSHWPDDCFKSHELMQRTHRPTYHVKSGNTRVALSRLTLAVFQDLGYDVDMKCADEHVALRLTSQCSRGGRGPSKAKAARSRRNKGTIRFWTRTPASDRFNQILLYNLGMELTRLRKQCSRFGAHLRKMRKRIYRLWIPKVRKKCRKTYRRVRRVVRISIRGALPSLSVGHDYYGA